MSLVVKGSVCTGCGKDLSRGGPYAKFADDKERMLCYGRSSQQYSEVCYRKAVGKLKICPGCGTLDSVEPGQICSYCRLHVKRGRAVTPKAQLAYYMIDSGDWVPSTYCNDAESQLGLTNTWPDKIEDVLIRTLVEAVAAGRTASSSFDVERAANRHILLPDGKKCSDSQSRHHPSFEATPKQAEAVKKFLALFGTMLKVQRQAGRNEGRSLLAQLASGDLSMNEWELKDRKLAGGDED